MLSAYTDASKTVNGAAGEAVLVTEDVFIDHTLQVFYGIDSSLHGELLSMVLAMQLVNSNFNDPQDVTIFCDCSAVVKRGNHCIATGYVNPKWAYSKDWTTFLEACENHNVCVKHIKGHREERSYNVICDLGTRLISTRQKGPRSVKNIKQTQESAN